MDLARRGLLRFSLHLYNNMHDVERVLDLTRKFLKPGDANRHRPPRREMKIDINWIKALHFIASRSRSRR
jgi:hypothetical protein